MTGFAESTGITGLPTTTAAAVASPAEAAEAAASAVAEAEAADAYDKILSERPWRCLRRQRGVSLIHLSLLHERRKNNERRTGKAGRTHEG